MYRNLAIGLLLSLAAGVCGSASAAVVDVTFKGVVTAGGGAAFGGVVTGDDFVAFYAFDSSASDTSIPGVLSGYVSSGFPGALISSTLTINGYSVSASGGSLSGASLSETPPLQVFAQSYNNECSVTCYTLQNEVDTGSLGPGIMIEPLGLSGTGGGGEYLLVNGGAVSEDVMLADQSVTVTIDEVSAAPEPTMWTLMILGVAFLGRALRARANPILSHRIRGRRNRWGPLTA